MMYPRGSTVEARQLRRDYHRKWRRKNRKKDRRTKRKWVAKNPEKNRSAKRRWLVNNPERRRAVTLRWRIRNSEKRKKIARQYRKKNQAALNAASLAAYHADPKRHRQNALRRKYGITLEQHHGMRRRQNNRCAICCKIFKTQKNIRVDHCHKTNVVRGLLCYLCNVGLGFFRDSPVALNRAIKYLRKKR